jgi:hypothetical protein
MFKNKFKRKDISTRGKIRNSFLKNGYIKKSHTYKILVCLKRGYIGMG